MLYRLSLPAEDVMNTFKNHKSQNRREREKDVHIGEYRRGERKKHDESMNIYIVEIVVETVPI